MKHLGEKKEIYRKKQPEKVYKIFFSLCLPLPKLYLSKISKMKDSQEDFKWFPSSRKTLFCLSYRSRSTITKSNRTYKRYMLHIICSITTEKPAWLKIIMKLSSCN